MPSVLLFPSLEMEGRTREEWARQYLRGRWTCILEQCLKLLREKHLASCAHYNVFFAAKLEETLFHAEQFAQQMTTASSGSLLAQGSDDFEECADNRFCELALSFFRLRMCLVCLWPFGGETEVSYETEVFVKREYHRMFLTRPDGRGRSLEYRPLQPPSLAWLREGECFRLLELNMESLIEACVLGELDFFEIENLGSGAGQLELAKQRSADGTATERDSAKFWKELAVSLLANVVDIDRALLVSEKKRCQAERHRAVHLEDPSDVEDEDSDAGPVFETL